MKHFNYTYLLLLLLIVIIIIYINYSKNQEREGIINRYYRPQYRRFRKLLNDYIFYYIK